MTSKFVGNRLREEAWRPEVVPASIVGLSRDVSIYLAVRRTNLIKNDEHGDSMTYCPSKWWDLGIGSGPCGLGCRGCFLMLTHRSMRDPLRHVVYENLEDFWRATNRWLRDLRRQPQHTLGLGIDCSDSLLYEGVTGHARHLIPMFANAEQNPKGNLLFLVTKSTNVGYLEGLPTRNVAVTFSLNPESIADLWEGKWPDTLERITPPISARLAACLQAQRFGFETRWRLDPILVPPGWQTMYEEFFAEAAGMGLRPHRITLGTYRQKTQHLDTWRKKWELPAMEWKPSGLTEQGTHYRPPEADRCRIYGMVADLSRKYFADCKVGLCKETYTLRDRVGLSSDCCNCLI